MEEKSRPLQSKHTAGIGTYFKHIAEASHTLWQGLKLTWRHLLQAREKRTPIGVADGDYFKQQTGIVTVQYPRESLPVPDNARYRLHNEIDDCIVCDKCAKICPVDCIEIEPIKSTETIGLTSDGTPKRLYAAKFDIDMAKCCFCGLCTTVCPTECLTMTKAYDFSEFDVADHTYAFSEMTPLEILQKRRELEVFQQQKEAQKAAAKPAAARPAGARPVAGRPMPPRPAAPKTDEGVQEQARRLMEQQRGEGTKPEDQALLNTPNPVAKSAPTPEGTEDSPAPGAEKPTFRPRPNVARPNVPRPNAARPNAARPMMKPKGEAAPEQEAASPPSSDEAPAVAPRPRPVMKPVIKKADSQTEETAASGPAEAAKPAKPRPVMRPVVKKQEPAVETTPAENPAKRPRPVMKPLPKKPAGEGEHQAGETPRQAAEPDKPRPILKPMVPKQVNQPDEGAAQKEERPEEIKRPRPVVKPKVVTRKPPREGETEEEKRQDDSQRPGAPGTPQ